MSIPTATYRIQFRNGMTFDRAAALVPYLKKMGISHLYASPIFTATRDSTHGYDVTDVNEIDPAIGGRAGFDRLVSTLKQAGLGLIIDIVPNHMAASLENGWWHDVLEHGKDSRYANYFDIDWSRRLTLPFLGDDIDTVLENGDLAVKRDPQTGKPALAYFESYYPLTPESWQGREEAVLQLRSKAGLEALHQQQPWRLMSWRDAARDLSYRRFFEVTGLVGVRVEDPTVFRDAHRLILELVHSGAVDGLRVDHVDGLADPKGYLTQLRREAGEACYITVEKILGEGEQIPSDWPISGTTGYEFIAALSHVLVNNHSLDALRQACESVSGQVVQMDDELRKAKCLMADRNFAGEFSRLMDLASAIAEGEHIAVDPERLRSALRELLVAFPVYRTYGNAHGLPANDQQRLQAVADGVRASEHAPDSHMLDFLLQIMQGDVASQSTALANSFRTRFQQLTGPLMAKSIEDTLFYRQNSALALNEVGAEPLQTQFSPQQFHHEMATRLTRQPDALSASSTHDTKRGEDARARLYTLTEAPQRWAENVARWRELNRQAVGALEDGPAPEPSVEWMLYQALAGVWPPTLDPRDSAGLDALAERFAGYVEKALREAKLRTDWTENNTAYEQAVLGYARHLLSPANQPFLQDFVEALQPFIHAGLVNSLSQRVIKLTAPGVPDVYQGSEALDFSLVDPDNRREPDYAVLEAMLGSATTALPGSHDSWLSGQVNQLATLALLNLRRDRPELFARGTYLPLTAEGAQSDRLLAFARTQGSEAIIVVTSRRVFDAQLNLEAPPATHWAATGILLPDELAHRRYRNVLSGETITLTDRISLETLNNYWALALLAC
ncbi:malto-oligosyltrehalose synthase [Pantoea ananatis]|uniref:malto-oligosyltrehalose synthase n=1 Tax=Pantoea ananas TaxID=553 RepID=UPI0021F72788|nr:malto-oligosyltrehalose synthase [Pantoea ananatis]MCW0328731.1 Maltooligosyl trehalose synthase [Pantoea ananatis]MCW0349921.1 Maltooligosyl trehalose synthase [Pantoea ananatis]